MSGSHNTHAKFSPSGLERTAVCTASTALVDDLIAKGTIPAYQPSNKFGVIGTKAHDLAEETLLHLLGKKISKNIEGAESIHHWLEAQVCEFEGEIVHEGYGEVENYVDYCMSQIQSDKDLVYVEVRAKLFYSDNPDDKGTCDFLILHKDGSITIVDLKWRRSGMVDSVRNLQLSAYGMSYIQSNMIFEPKGGAKVSLTTYNPLVAPYVDPWVTNYAELTSFCKDKITTPIRNVEEGNVMFVPGKKACQWCPAKEYCQARVSKVLTALPDTLGNGIIEDHQLVDLLQIKDEAIALFDDAEKRLYRLADEGKAQSGTRLVEARSNRRYKDPEAAGLFLTQHLDHDDVFDPPKIKSFTKVTPKLTPEIKKQFEAECIVKPKGKLKLVLTDEVSSESVSTLKSKLLKSISK